MLTLTVIVGRAALALKAFVMARACCGPPPHSTRPLFVHMRTSSEACQHFYIEVDPAAGCQLFHESVGQGWAEPVTTVDVGEWMPALNRMCAETSLFCVDLMHSASQHRSNLKCTVSADA